MTAPRDDEEPTQAVTPGADPTDIPDDPKQGDSEMTDPAEAAAAEFE